MNYMVRLQRNGKIEWVYESLLDFVPREVLDLMECTFVHDLGLCKLCEEMAYRAHVLQPTGRPHEYRNLCTILFHDAVKPDWKLSEVV